MKIFEEAFAFFLLLIWPISEGFAIEACVLFIAVLFGVLSYRQKWRTKLGIPLLFLIIAFFFHRIDMYFAYKKLNELCSGPIFIVHEVRKLGQDYWDKEGWPIFHDRDGMFLPEVFDGRYVKGKKHYKLDSVIGVRRSEYYLYDTIQQRNTVEYISYTLVKGFFRSFLGLGEYKYYKQLCGTWDFKRNEIPGSAKQDWLTSWAFMPIGGSVIR